MANDTKLLVLGMLMGGECHPYEIQQIIKKRQMHYYVKLAKGSLYYSFQQLEEAGMIEAVETIRDTPRPDKTIYRITSLGKKEFHRLFEKQMAKPYEDFHPLYTAFSFIQHADRDQVKQAIRERINEMKKRVEILEMLVQAKKAHVPCAIIHSINGALAHSKTELSWLKELEKDAESGALFSTSPKTE
ncbi:PadR family transcriptional regulator [Fictibacillus sp. Mic-4]|uniref:PadR family transcriptional regulator n=1 Tax=Fictibacillus sp. Mic-4 TaxID=3132826 RepID=UPI003CFAB3A3